MFKQITTNYRSTRSFQICVMFVAALALQRWLAFSHAGWIGFSVMMINAGFDSGANLHRTHHRFWGVVLGLLLSYLLWLMICMHYEMIFLVIPVVVFMAFFVMGQYYFSPTIFTVTLTALGTIYYTPVNYHVREFFFDYSRATLFAFGLCVFFEFFIFKKERLTHKFYFDLKCSLIDELKKLFDLVTTHPVRDSQYLKMCEHVNASITVFYTFFNTLKHDYHIQEKYFEDFHDFSALVDRAYQYIRELFVLKNNQENQLKVKTQCIFDDLYQLIQEPHV